MARQFFNVDSVCQVVQVDVGGDVRELGLCQLARQVGRVNFTGIMSDGVGQNPVTISGGGIVALAGTNTFAGATTVAAGTLLVNGSNGPSEITVDAATLGGSGTAGPLTLASGSRLAPGAVGPGTL